MGRLLGKLIKTGAAAGTAVAGVKVAQRVKENNPEGVQDVNGDGRVDYKDKVIEAEKAAKEIFEETKARIEEKEPEWKEKAGQTAQKAESVFGDVAGKAESVVKNVVDKLDDLF